MENHSYLIKDTTKSERIQLIKQWEECEGCDESGFDIWEFYRDYINGEKEIAEINASFSAKYVSEILED